MDVILLLLSLLLLYYCFSSYFQLGFCQPFESCFEVCFRLERVEFGCVLHRALEILVRIIWSSLSPLTAKYTDIDVPPNLWRRSVYCNDGYPSDSR